MKRIFILALAFFTMAPAFANPTPAAAQPPKKFSLQVDLNFQQPGEKGTFDVCMVKNTLKLSSDNHDWVKIQDQDNDNSEFYILLGKIESVTSTDVTMKFLVLDTNKKPIILSTPQLVLRYGEKSQIAIADKDDTMQLNVLANIG